jgi:hypothetical protein
MFVGSPNLGKKVLASFELMEPSPSTSACAHNEPKSGNLDANSVSDISALILSIKKPAVLIGWLNLRTNQNV